MIVWINKVLKFLKKETDLTIGVSQPLVVEDFIQRLDHPMIDVIKYLRQFILAIDKNIGEGIFWNAPTFYYTGKMEAFNPKDYKRYIVGFNFYRKDAIRLIFLRGADVDDSAGILEGDYKDGRRIISYKSLADIKKTEGQLKKIVKQLISRMN